MLTWFAKRRRQQKTAHKLYGSIVAQVRQPWFYGRLGLPDTLEGRFELLVLHMFLVLERLRASEGCEPAAQALVDAFIADMDVIHRELGVSDTKVPKKMHSTAAIFYGRLERYDRALSCQESDTLETALKTCIAPDDTVEWVAELGAYARRVRHALQSQDDIALQAGELTLPEPATVGVDQSEAS